MKAFKIDVETLGPASAALSTGAQVLAAECQKLHRHSPTEGVPGAVFERSDSAWEDFVDAIGSWVTTLESTITRIGTVGSDVTESDGAIARALDNLA